jgi:hypothetical protein
MLINSSSNLILGRYSSYYLAPFLSWKVHKTLFLPQFPLFLWNLKHSMHWPTNRPNWVLSAPMISVNFHSDHFLVLLPKADINTTPPLSPALHHSHWQPGSLSLSLNFACWTWGSLWTFFFELRFPNIVEEKSIDTQKSIPYMAPFI